MLKLNTLRARDPNQLKFIPIILIIIIILFFLLFHSFSINSVRPRLIIICLRGSIRIIFRRIVANLIIQRQSDFQIFLRTISILLFILIINFLLFLYSLLLQLLLPNVFIIKNRALFPRIRSYKGSPFLLPRLDL